MKFAAQTVLFLSSSFAFVNSDGVACNAINEWPCPTHTTDLELYGGFSGTIPTEIGLLNSVTYLRIGTCFGVVRSFLVPLSLSLPLTFG